MNAENMIGLMILSLVALFMVAIGIGQMRKQDEPVGFYNMIAPPKKEEISDIVTWNQKHGMIWILYGICIEAGYWLAYLMPTEILEMVFLMGGILIPLPFMILRHHSLERKYKQR